MRGNIQSAAAHTHTHMSVHIIKHRMHTGHSTHWNWSECPRARRTRMYRMMVRRWIWIRCASITQYFAHVDLCCGNVRIVPTHTPMQLFRHIFFPFSLLLLTVSGYKGIEAKIYWARNARNGDGTPFTSFRTLWLYFCSFFVVRQINCALLLCDFTELPMFRRSFYFLLFHCIFDLIGSECKWCAWFSPSNHVCDGNRTSSAGTS